MENTKIEWATDTFNPWEGCAKVSPGCKNCYAEGQHKLHHAALGKGDNPGTCWGVNAPRLGKSEENWKKPLKWNRQAAAAGVRRRVFCASMADVFEPQSALSAGFAGQTGTVPTGAGRTRTVRFVDLATERLRLLRLIHDTPHLDWLLLTKRPENIVPALEAAHNALCYNVSEADWSDEYSKFSSWLYRWSRDIEAPANVWLGTSVENQEQADARIPHLLAAPAAVRFLSCEPLLGSVDLRDIVVGAGHVYPLGTGAATSRIPGHPRINWVIVGGESGPRARPMHPDWARTLRDQCQAAGVAFHFKQWGEWMIDDPDFLWESDPRTCLVSYSGQKIGQEPGFDAEAAAYIGKVGSGPTEQMVYAGKKLAGRLLDGRTWDELPKSKEVAA